MRPRTAVLAAVPLAAAALGVWWDGGYSSGARLAFGLAGVAAAAVALAVARDDARDVLREPVVLVLLGLAIAGAVSALWTLGLVGDSLRWALVSAGYAGVAVAAGVAARRRGGVEALAAGIAVLALAAAADGLGAAALREAPYAERIAGVWRPGGPFEYPPALALLQVSALPVLLAGMVRGRPRALPGAAAVGMALAGGVLALAASRTSMAMAVAVAGAAVAFPAATVRGSRTVVAAAVGLGVVAGVAVQLAAGGGTPAGQGGTRTAALVTLVAVAVLAAPVWLVARQRLGDSRLMPPDRKRHRPWPLAVAAAVLVVAALAGSLAYGSAADRGRGPAAGFLHGRTDTWRAAVETFADRPLAGTGADAFLVGSARHQNGQAILFAHDLPLELAAELGLVGIALGLALYGSSARLLWLRRGLPGAWLLGPATAAFLLAGLVDWPWHLSGAGAVWSIALGGLAGAARTPANNAPGRPRIDSPGRRKPRSLQGDSF